MRKGKLKKLTAVALSAALMVSALSVSAFAQSGTAREYDSDLYEAPDTVISVDSSILSGATAAANTTLLSILGINVTSTDAAGVYNSAGTNGDSSPINLQIFGSEWNSTPDPYYYNFYVNFDDTTGTVGDCDTSAYSGWTGDYTLIYSGNKSGPSGAVTTLLDSLTVNSVTKYSVNPAFFYEPDLLFSRETVSDSALIGYGYSSSTNPSTAYTASNITAYNTANSSSYSPVVIGGWNTSQYCINSGTGFSNIESMAEGIQAIASAIESKYSTKSGRYGDISDIADELYAFSVNVHDYAVSTGKTTAIYCFSPTYNSDGTVTVSQVSGRYAQYLDGIGVDVYDSLGGEAVSLSNFISAMQGGVVFGASSELEAALEGSTVTCVPLPTTVYGMTMQSADNMLGTAYCFGALYGTESNSLPTYQDMLAYWVTYFYHVDEDYLVDAMALILGKDADEFEYETEVDSFTSTVEAVSHYQDSED